MGRDSSKWVLLGASALLLVGCADQHSFNGAPDNLSPEERRLQNVEDKLAVVERRVGNLETARDNSAVESDIRDMRGELETLQHQMAMQTQQENSALSNIDARLSRLESSQSSASSAPPPPPESSQTPSAGSLPPVGAVATAPPPPVAPASPPGNSSADEQQAYLKNFNLLRSGKNTDAITGFKAQLSQYPQGSYADNAYYWMGMAYYNDRDPAQALSSFQSLLQNFPNSPRVPDSLLKVGMIQQEQSKPDQARAAYQRVVQSYPNTTAAATARQRLAQLK